MSPSCRFSNGHHQSQSLLLGLPNELLSGVLGYLEFPQLQTTRLVCRQIAAYIDDNWINTIVHSRFQFSAKGLATLKELAKTPSVARQLSSLRITGSFACISEMFLSYQLPMHYYNGLAMLWEMEQYSSLDKTLRQLPNLHTLDIFNDDSQPDFHFYSEPLDWYRKPLGSHHVQLIFKAMVKSGRRLKTMNLDFSLPHYGVPVHELVEASSVFHSLENFRLALRMDENTPSDKEIQNSIHEVLASLLSVQNLDIRFTDPNVSALYFRQLMKADLPRLRNITLTDIRFSGLDCVKLLSTRPSITDMNLVRCCFDSLRGFQETLENFATYTTLKKLSLRMIRTPSEIVKYVSLPQQPTYPHYFAGYNKDEEYVVFKTRDSIDKFMSLVIDAIGP